jgi:hypothetical protein
MTLTYALPLLHGAGSLHALTLTHEEGRNTGADSFQATYGSLICATS